MADVKTTKVKVTALVPGGFYRGGRFWPPGPNGTEADLPDAELAAVEAEKSKLKVERLDGSRPDPVGPPPGPARKVAASPTDTSIGAATLANGAPPHIAEQVPGQPPVVSPGDGAPPGGAGAGGPPSVPPAKVATKVGQSDQPAEGGDLKRK